MKKILLVSSHTQQSQGGIAVWTDIFLEYCNKNNIKYDLLNIATIGVRAIQGNSKRNMIDEYKRTKGIFDNLNNLLSSDQYGVAHINTSCGSFGLIRDYLTVRQIKRRQPSCKCIIHFHCDAQKQCNSIVSKYFLKKILSISDKVFVLNTNNAKYLKKVYDKESIVVSNFVRNDIVRTTPKVINGTIKKAVFVGYVQPSKGIAEIYELAKRFPTIDFYIIGEVRSDVKAWNKTENVILCGPLKHKDVTEYLDDADVFLFPSHGEGFSMALVESMARGLPSLATKVGANEEMLEGLGGILVDVSDIESMEKALIKLQSPELRKEMSAWSIAKVVDNYTIDVVMNNMKCIYEQC